MAQAQAQGQVAQDPPADLTPFLKRGLHYRVATVLYRYVFQPFDNLLDRVSTYFTRRWVEANTPRK